VGIADRDRIIDGSDIGVGNVIIGLASSGLHSNGYSLVRKICFEELNLNVDDRPGEFNGMSVGEVLLEPTRIYVRAVTHLLKQFTISGIVHITGGGFQDNIPRVLPDSCKAVIALNSWDMPPVFTFLQDKGHISQEEMLRTFNCGVGMVLIVPKSQTEEMMFQLEALGEKSFVLGDIETREEHEPPVVFL
jgi:phosphoribosylformylglycinamidine cyclo-ligase